MIRVAKTRNIQAGTKCTVIIVTSCNSLMTVELIQADKPKTEGCLHVEYKYKETYHFQYV